MAGDKEFKIRLVNDRNKLKLGKKHLGVRVSIKERGKWKTSSKFFGKIQERRKWVEEVEEGIENGSFAFESRKDKVKIQSRMLSDVIDVHLADGRAKGWSPKTYDLRDFYLAKMLKYMGDLPVTEIERPDVVQFIEQEKSNGARHSACTAAVAMLTWAGNIDQGRDWVGHNKFLRLKYQRLLVDKKPIGILNNQEVALLLHHISEKHKAAMALCFFTGLRPDAELPYLYWRDIDFKKQIITITKSKVRFGRVMANLPECLWDWLGKYKGDPDEKIIVSYNAFRLARGRTAAKLGIEYPSDGARHTFGTNGYWRGEEWARRIMGHTDGSRVFHRNYVNTGVDAEEAEEFFSLDRGRVKRLVG